MGSSCMHMFLWYRYVYGMCNLGLWLFISVYHGMCAFSVVIFAHMQRIPVLVFMDMVAVQLAMTALLQILFQGE